MSGWFDLSHVKGAPIDFAVIAVYFVAIVAFGLWFGKYTRNTSDFFFGGQRFAWWLIAFSGIATTVGSYSFVKYSEVGYEYGISSTQSYLNDWFWIPILLLLWLPILYFGRIQSVPEYFLRRFGPEARFASLIAILIYLVGYVGVNLYTLGTVMEGIIGVPVLLGATMTAFVVMLYMFAGGQTSVIMTDLAQGIILLIAGLGLLVLGVAHVGGVVNFWALLPESHRYGFSEFSAPDKFSFVGIFAQDGLANTGAFVLMNQGMIMRFLSMRSVRDGQKMAVFWILVLAPLAAIAVSSGGWVAKVLVENGEIETTAKTAFVDASHYLAVPGVFGFILAALTAALMSTADTLVSAVSAIFINDIYRPYLVKGRPDKHYLKVARVSSTVTVIVGLVLVVIYMKQDSIYQVHGQFTAAVTPPIVMSIFLGIFWKRYTSAAAIATIVVGGVAVGLSFVPSLESVLIKPFAFGMGEASYGFMRALYGLVACGVIGLVVSLFTRPKSDKDLVGLVHGTQLQAMELFKGSPVNRTPGTKVTLRVIADASLPIADVAVCPQSALSAMAASEGDMLYACDTRWWFGGLRSVHLRAGEPGSDDAVRMSPEAIADAHFTDGQWVVVEKLL
ncbi:MAG: sodium:solute symporter [Candidatus Hydrogenedentota bacterium]